jgi:hypothetical protein
VSARPGADSHQYRCTWRRKPFLDASQGSGKLVTNSSLVRADDLQQSVVHRTNQAVIGILALMTKQRILAAFLIAPLATPVVFSAWFYSIRPRSLRLMTNGLFHWPVSPAGLRQTIASPLSEGSTGAIKWPLRFGHGGVRMALCRRRRRIMASSLSENGARLRRDFCHSPHCSFFI